MYELETEEPWRGQESKYLHLVGNREFKYGINLRDTGLFLACKILYLSHIQKKNIVNHFNALKEKSFTSLLLKPAVCLETTTDQ